MIAALPMYDRPENRAAHDALWSLIRDGLRARGIPTQPTQTEAEEPAPEVRDFERIKRELPGRATES